MAIPAAVGMALKLGTATSLGKSIFDGVKEHMGGDVSEDDTEKNEERDAPGEPATEGQAPAAVPAVAPQMAMPMMQPAMPMMAAAPVSLGMPGMYYSQMGPMMGQQPMMQQAGATQIVAPQREQAANTKFGGKHGSMMETMGAGLFGAVGAFVSGKKDGAEGMGMLKKVLAGGGSGALAKMSHESIAEEGGGLRAGLTGGLSAALASTIKEGGPGMLKAGAFGFAGSGVANAAHDSAEKRGHSALGDALGGTLQGGSLGYALGGDLKSAGLFGAGGAGLSSLDGALDRKNIGSFGDLGDMVKGLGGDRSASAASGQVVEAAGPEVS